MRPPTQRTPQVFLRERIVSVARATVRLPLAPALLRRGGDALAIQEETREATIQVRPGNPARRRAPMVLLLVFVAVELAWIAVIGYLLYLAI